MGSPSSTSSSEPGARLPLGGLVALLLIVAANWGLPRVIPWDAVADRIAESHFAEAGLVRDRIALARLAQAPPALPRVAVVGSSRTEAGFHPEWLDAAPDPPLAFAKLAHPGMWIFAMRTLAADLARERLDAVVFVLSEFELHTPLELRATLTTGDLFSVAELAAAAGPGLAWRERRELARVAVAGFLETYRLRELLGRAGLDGLRRFPLDARLRHPDPEGESWLMAPGATRRVPRRVLEQLQAEMREHFTPDGAFAASIEMAQLRSLRRGRDARLHGQLLRGAVRELRAAGTAVVLFEAPLFPAATLLYDAAGLRADFLALGRSLAAEDGVAFVPLEAGPDYPASDFRDLTHLDRAGAVKLTRGIVSAVHAALGDARPSPPR